MCGIVGITGFLPVVPLLLDSLKRLEYRGYDSAGIATIESGVMKRCRAQGKLINLEKALISYPLSGCLGLGHTRWATHGAPTKENAHPHFSKGVAVVHNGILENFRDLKETLLEKGYEFHSSTDTEVVAHLIAEELKQGATPKEAAFRSFAQLEGAFALAVIFEQESDLIIAVRNGPPLAIGYGNNQMFLASDTVAFPKAVHHVTWLEDGDRVVLRSCGALIQDEAENPVVRKQSPFSNLHFSIDKGHHRHFMAKEIHEQPEALSHALAYYIDFTENKIKDLALPFNFSTLNRLIISGCGTAYLSGFLAKYWFERYARLPVDSDVASEFRYREPPLEQNCAALFISQSGETADTLASLRYCSQASIPSIVLLNNVESTMAREADCVFPVLAGPEIGVASTKAFTCQLVVLACLAIRAAKERGTIDPKEESLLIGHLAEVPKLMRQILKLEQKIEKIAQDVSHYKNVLYLGRGIHYPLALEGALKLKEVSYIHAEGYAAGELKHGPMSLVDENMPVVILGPFDRMFDKTLSNIQEVAARGARIILLTDEKGSQRCTLEVSERLILPEAPEIIHPFIYALPIQMLAYFTAVSIGTDVDQPRNLAKSVTVE